MSLLTLLKQYPVPSWVLTKNVILTPTSFTASSVVHFNIFECPDFSERIAAYVEDSDAEIQHYSNLNDELYGNQTFSGYDLFSLEYILKLENNFCLECASFAGVAEADATYTFDLEAFLELLNDCTRRMSITLTSFLDTEDTDDLDLMFELLKYVNYFSTWSDLRNFYEDFVNKLSSDRFPSEQEMMDCQRTASEFVAHHSLKSPVQLPVGGLTLLELLNDFENDLVKKLTSNTEYTIFKTNYERLDADLAGIIGYDDAYFLSKFFFYPGFRFDEFCVLPYSVFLAFKIYLTKHSSYFDVSIRTELTLEEKPSQKVIESMRALYNSENDTLSKYSSLHEIATTV